MTGIFLKKKGGEKIEISQTKNMEYYE